MLSVIQCTTLSMRSQEICITFFVVKKLKQNNYIKFDKNTVYYPYEAR
jgi:hypothetical protein